MRIHNKYVRLSVLFLAAVFLMFGAGAAVGAGLKDLSGVTSAAKPDLSGMVMDKLGVKAPEADGLMEENKMVSGEVADPSKLAKYGMEAKEGDKVGLTNLGGGSLGVQSLMGGGGDMMKLDMKDVFGAASKVFMK